MITNLKEDFNWDLYSHYKGNKLVKNESIVTEHYEKLFCFEPYARDMYKSYATGIIESPKDLVNGELYVAKLYSVTEDKAVALTDSGQSIFIDIRKENKDCDRLNIPRIDFNINRKLDLIITINPQGYYDGSVVDGFFKTIRAELFNSINSKDTAYTVRIKSINKGGFMVDLSGIECFLPGSLAAANKIVDFESYIGKDIPVMVEGYMEDKDIFIVSNKKYLQRIMLQKIAELDLNKKYSGRVTGTSNFGVFVEWEDVYTGLIHKTEFGDPNNITGFSEGDSVEFYIKEIKDDNRLTLTFLPPLDRNSKIIELKRDFDDGIISSVACIIKSFRNGGVLVELQDSGLMGMVSNNKGGNKLAKVKKLGDVVDVDLLYIDINNEKINLRFDE